MEMNIIELNINDIDIGGKIAMRFSEMTYKEFLDFCNDRACDGQWGMLEAMSCIKIVEEINAIQIKAFGFIPLKKKTKKAREEAWRKNICR